MANKKVDSIQSLGVVETNTLKVVSGASAGHVLTSDASGNAVWDAPIGGSIATTQQVIAVPFDFTDYNTQVTVPSGAFQYAQIATTTILPTNAIVTGAGVFIDQAWNIATEMYIGTQDNSGVFPAGPPAGLYNRFQDKTDNVPVTSGMYWKNDWSKQATPTAVYLTIGANLGAPMGNGTAELVIRYVETPRT